MPSFASSTYLEDLILAGWTLVFERIDYPDKNDYAVLLKLIANGELYAQFERMTAYGAIRAAHKWNERQIVEKMGHSG